MEKRFTKAYREAGYVLTSPRNQWSAIKDDGSGVALTIWSDEIDRKCDPWEMDLRGHPRLSLWQDRTGNKVRTKHVSHAIDRLDGRVDLILCVAEDPKADVRKVKSARHWFQRFGRIDRESFDSDSGVFRVQLFPAVVA